jgi:hypothetical protein
MKIFHDPSKRNHSVPRAYSRWKTAFVAVVLVGSLGLAATAKAQVVPSANSGPFKLSAGGTGSGYYLQYGSLKLLGASAFVDADMTRGLGVEAEGRWLEWHQINNVHVETYSAGLRYHMNFRNFQPYAKGLIGFGDFNFPFNYAHGRYLTVTAGGGVDYHWHHRISFRVADVEWQYWPQFTFGAMNSAGVSAGVKVGIF